MNWRPTAELSVRLRHAITVSTCRHAHSYCRHLQSLPLQCLPDLCRFKGSDEAIPMVHVTQSAVAGRT